MFTGVGYVLTASVCLGRGLNKSGPMVKPAQATSLLPNLEFLWALDNTIIPACSDRVGEIVRREVIVDRFGDKVTSAALPGDTWRTKHDQVKSTINSLCEWSKLPVTCEVFNLFARLIPQEGLNRLERGRKSNQLLPV